MTDISDEELGRIVTSVVRATLGISASPTTTPSPLPAPKASGSNTVALGADHGGYRLKELLADHLAKAGFTIVDCGTSSEEAVDYPDFAAEVARKVAAGEAWRGIVVDGAGIGSCMVANKIPGIRAAMCHDHATAVNSRQHNDANVLTLGAGLIGDALARQIVDVWLATEFAGGRHTRRIEKIMALQSNPRKAE